MNRSLEHSIERLDQAALSPLRLREGELRGAVARLHVLSPPSVIARGYAVMEDRHGEVVRSVHQVPRGEHARVRVTDWWLGVEV